MTGRYIPLLFVLVVVAAFSCSEKSEKAGKPGRTPEALLMAPAPEEEPGFAEHITIDEPPVPMKIVNPPYPEAASKAGIQGRIFIKALVSKDGTVKKAVAIRTEGSGDLERAALDAALQWTFTPAKVKGQPVAVWVTIPFVFKLK